MTEIKIVVRRLGSSYALPILAIIWSVRAIRTVRISVRLTFRRMTPWPHVSLLCTSTSISKLRRHCPSPAR
jgi:hypothetical protein